MTDSITLRSRSVCGATSANVGGERAGRENPVSFKVILHGVSQFDEPCGLIFHLAGPLAWLYLPLPSPSEDVALPEQLESLALGDVFRHRGLALHQGGEPCGHVVDEGLVGHHLVCELYLHHGFISFSLWIVCHTARRRCRGR